MNHQQAISSHATERYLLDEMTEIEKYAFEDHYFDCAECADDVRAAALMRDGVKSGLLDVGEAPATGVTSVTSATSRAANDIPRGIVHQMPQRSSSTRTSWYRSPVVPWAVAATLAIAIGLQTMNPTPGGSGSDGPGLQALAPVTLRPASRGAVPAITVAGEAPLTLALDVNGTADTSELTYELTGPDNRVALTGQVAAPAPGTPLFLLVSPSTFPAEGRYSLAVRDAARNELLGEYAFDVNTR